MRMESIEFDFLGLVSFLKFWRRIAALLVWTTRVVDIETGLKRDVLCIS